MAKDLEAAGLERRQAEGITNAVSDAVADLVTKDDLRTEMALLRTEMALLGSRLTNRVYGAVAVAVGIIVGALAIATAIVLRATG